MLDAQPRSTTWTVQYSTGGTAIDNVGEPVYVRIAALSGSSGSGNRDTCGIDDVSLPWTNASTPSTTITVTPTTLAGS